MMRILSPWYDGTIKPVYPGPYLTRYDKADFAPVILKWTGDRWTYLNGDECPVRLQWCGLSFDPERAWFSYEVLDPKGVYDAWVVEVQR